ncbi:hypothetical protein CBR_g39495 [Chara braunii]|uniref:CCHC-type domain-containing protein n=1 Tax=Chara braunii TaxID=69332 RepID=A0A388LRZ0_CHABU|nr:hypothetical protein CBR_g39495 [Chara braunii]|eukprot:GBG85031.1 hypothetical protein CBR_g39495 [Chara braunii]
MYGGGRYQGGGMGGYGNTGGYENRYGGNTVGVGYNGNTGGGTGGSMDGYMGGGSGGNSGRGGRQPSTCDTCGKPGHYSRECWMRRGRQDDNELEEIRQQHRTMTQERREAEEKRRVEEQRRLQEENERRREQDMVRRTEEIRLQLEAGLEEKWRQQTKQAVEAAAAAKAKAEEARARAEEAHAKAEEARARFEMSRIEKTRKCTHKVRETPASTSRKRARKYESEDMTSEDSEIEGDSTDSDEELRKMIERLKKEKRTRRSEKRERSKKREKITYEKTPIKTPEKKQSTTERGECSKGKRQTRRNREGMDDMLRNTNDIGAGFEEPWDEYNQSRGSPRTGGLRFDIPRGGDDTREEEPKTPMENGYKGLTAKCSREGIIDYCLSTQKILSSKKATMLRKVWQKKGIRYTRKPEIIDVLAREQVKLAYEGFAGLEAQGGEEERVEVNLGEDITGTEKRGTRSSVQTAPARIQWLTKYLVRSEITTNMLDLKEAGVYIVASPWSKKVYVGSTIRSTMQRWREHLSNADTEVIGSSPKLYRWMRHYGLGNFVIIPIRHANGEDDRAFERHLIQDFSPSLNTSNTNCREDGKTRSKRKGRRERKRLKTRRREKVKSTVTFEEENVNKRRVSLLMWLEEASKKEAKCERRVTFHKGETWADGWRKIKKRFGMTKVRLNGRLNKLAAVRVELQQGVTVVFVGITKTTTTTAIYIQELRWMLKKPFLFKGLVSRTTN